MTDGTGQVPLSGPGLRRLAAEGTGRQLVLDASRLRVISTRGLGLLTAVRLLAERRAAVVIASGCCASVVATLSLARIQVQQAAAPGELQEPERDWTPWWTGLAANA